MLFIVNIHCKYRFFCKKKKDGAKDDDEYYWDLKVSVERSEMVGRSFYFLGGQLVKKRHCSI